VQNFEVIYDSSQDKFAPDLINLQVQEWLVHTHYSFVFKSHVEILH